jgi:hypothetical protein
MPLDMDNRRRRNREYKRKQRAEMTVRDKQNLAAWEKARRSKKPGYWRKRRGLPDPTRVEPARCECCGGLPNGRGKLHLDHDHATGKFRGWLCAKCNLGISLLGDLLVGTRNAVAYLERAG